LNNITFTYVGQVDDKEPLPTPSSKNLPEWYKAMESYLPDSLSTHLPNGRVIKETVKKCMPVYDSITSGYMLYSPCDVIVTVVNGQPFFEWYSHSPVIEFHINEQASRHPKVNTPNIPKWVNFWSIKTPKGYSCLFTPPMNGDDAPFAILPGIVDTDEFNTPVNFPFTFKDPNFVGIIPEGTPICQILPFKREEWKMEIGSDAQMKEAHKQMWKVNRIDLFNYKKTWWNRKSYK
jgi:hypothetical protein